MIGTDQSELIFIRGCKDTKLKVLNFHGWWFSWLIKIASYPHALPLSFTLTTSHCAHELFFSSVYADYFLFFSFTCYLCKFLSVCVRVCIAWHLFWLKLTVEIKFFFIFELLEFQWGINSLLCRFLSTALLVAIISIEFHLSKD